MKKLSIFSLVAVICMLLATPSTFATILITDNFGYTLSQPVATNNGWTSFIFQANLTEKSTAVDEVNVFDQTLSYAGYLSSNMGKSILLDGLNKDVYRLFPYIDGVTSNKTTGGLDITTGGRVASGDVYASMLINVERAFYGAGDPEDTKGDCFFAFGANTWGIGAAGRIYTRKLGSGYQIGVTRAGNAKTVWDPTERSLNTTYLVVIKYSIIASPNGEKNDRVYLAINPALGSTEPSWIANDITDANQELPSIVGAVQFIQKINTSANNPLTITTKMKVGGLRVATTWAEVGELDNLNNLNPNKDSDIKISSSNGKLSIIGAIGKDVEVFDITGKLVSKTHATQNTTEILIQQKGLMLVKIENENRKIMM